MEFATLDKMIEELEKEKEDYVNSIDTRINKIKQHIAEMKNVYREETMPTVNSMVDYLLDNAKKRLGEDRVIEACDIPVTVMDDFYEEVDRKIDKRRIVLAIRVEQKEKDLSFLLGKPSYWLFFTDSEVYLWEGHFWARYPYKSFITLKSYGIGYCEVELDGSEEENDVYISRVLGGEEGQKIARLLLDLRDFANRS